MSNLLDNIKAIAGRKKFIIYTEPYRLNIVGLRADSIESNSFNDEIHAFYYDENRKVNYFLFKGTTDPGTYWLKNPISPKGTAILPEGQYKDAYAIGLHKGEKQSYTALVQVKPITVIRDFDRNTKLDFKSGIKETGMFGINIHHAKKEGKTYSIDKYSAGCQVFQDAQEYELFLKMCEKHRQLYGNKFTYTLIDFRTVRKQMLRELALTASVIAGFLLGLFIRKKIRRKKK